MAAVPSLEGSTYLTDPQSIIAYTIRRFMRMPRHTVPMMDDHIISLPWLVYENRRDPDTLVSSIQSALQKCLVRIFNGERNVNVSASYSLNDNDTYDVTISVIYTTIGDEINQIGTTISLNKTTGRLIIPEDNLNTFFGLG